MKGGRLELLLRARSARVELALETLHATRASVTRSEQECAAVQRRIEQRRDERARLVGAGAAAVTAVSLQAREQRREWLDQDLAALAREHAAKRELLADAESAHTRALAAWRLAERKHAGLLQWREQHQRAERRRAERRFERALDERYAHPRPH
jgi:hypothetical protein